MRMQAVFLRLFLGCHFLFHGMMLYAEKPLSKEPHSVHQECSIVAEAEPSTFVNGTVNVISGTLYHATTDLIVPGPEPLHFRHYYNSDSFFRQWMGYTALATNFPTRIQGSIRHQADEWSDVLVEEDGGSIVKYIAEDEPNMEFYADPKLIQRGYTNCGSGEISGRTNLKNSTFYFETSFHHGLPKSGKWTAILADGTKRDYFRTYDYLSTMNLKSERKPSGNRVFYEYHHDGTLRKITTTNHDEKETLNWLKLDFDEKERQATVTSSNGKVAEYHFFKGNDGHDNRTQYVEKIVSSDTPTVHFEYKKHDGRYYASALRWPQGRFLEIEYDHKGRVKAQCAPVGPDGQKKTIYEFEYKPSEYHTNVIDALGRKTTYWYSSEKRLKIIDQHKKGSLFRRTRFYWGKDEHIHRGKRDKGVTGNLVAKTIENNEGKALTHWKAHYDSHGNIVKEELSGNLTGKKPCCFHVDETGEIENSHIEHYRKYATYSSDGFNLKTSQSEDDGTTIKYHYKPYTNLLTAKFTYDGGTIKIREFFEYDTDGVMTTNIIDDGASHDSEKLNAVTERRIMRIIPVRGHGGHGLGQPAIIKEYYLDREKNKEVKLKERRFEYDFAGHVKKEECYDSDGKKAYALFFSYDDKGRLIKKIDAEGREFLYEYDDNNNKTKEELKHSDAYTTLRYDKANRLIEETQHFKDNASLSTRHEYDLVGNKIAFTDHFGNTTDYEYDDLNRLVKITLPEVVDEHKNRYRPQMRKKYDLFDNVIEEIDANGNSTKYSYTIRKQPTEITYADGSQERFEYNLNGTMAHRWDKNGTKTSFTYDFLGRVIKTEVFDDENQRLLKTTNSYNAFHLLSSTDPMGYTTHYGYDDAGRKIKQKKETEKTTYAYDSLGRLASEKKWFGSNSEEYIARLHEYDSLDRPVVEYVENGDGTLLRKNRWSYDIFGNKAKAVSSISEHERSVVETHYDCRNLPVATIDELGNRTTIRYHFHHKNSRGQNVLQKIITDPLGNQTIEVLDVLGRVKYVEKRTAKEALPESALLSCSIFVYDAVGNKVRQIEKVLLGTTQAREYVIQNKYDPQNRLIQVIEEPETKEEKKTRYEYSSKGYLGTITQPNGCVIHHSYDALNRLVKMKSSDGTIDYRYEYDRNNNPTVITDGIHNIVHRRAYDPWRRIIKDSLYKDVEVTLTYDPLGRLIGFYLPDESSVLYDFTKGRLRHVSRHDKSGTLLYQHRYSSFDLQDHVLKSRLIAAAGTLECGWDKKGRAVTLSAPHWSEEIEKIDAADNLQQVSYVINGTKQTAYYEYNCLYQLIQEKAAEPHTYRYDSLDNRLQKDDREQGISRTNRLLHDGETKFTYDANGNCVQMELNASCIRYRYDALNRLIEATDDRSFLARYVYDSTHRRIAKQLFQKGVDGWKESEQRRFLWLLDREVGALNRKNNLVEFRVLGLGKGAEIGATVAIEIGNRLYAPIHDHRGNICQLVDASSGEPQATLSYSAFGEQDHNEYLCPWQFASKRYDTETGLYYFGKRYYSAKIGRWMTPDPVGFADGPNLYAYVHNRPMIVIDPYGLTALDEREPTRSVPGVTLPPKTPFNADSDGSCVGEVGSRSFADGSSITYINGQMNKPADARASAEQLSKIGGDIKVRYFYNPTQGLAKDLYNSMYCLRTGTPPPAGKALEKMFIEYFNNAPDGAEVLHFNHSQGSIITKRVLDRLDKPEQQRIQSIAIAPGDFITSEESKNPHNYVSKRDFVPWVGIAMDLIGAFFHNYEQEPLETPGIDTYDLAKKDNSIHILEPHPDAPLFDHPFCSPKYNEKKKEHISAFIAKHGVNP